MKQLFLLLLICLNSAAQKKFSLITFLYNETDQERALEYIACLEKNIAHPLIDEIHIIYDFATDDRINSLLLYVQQRPVTLHYVKGRPTFYYCVELAKRIAKNPYIIIANGDIYFNETLSSLDDYDMTDKFIGLTRWNVQADGTLEIFKQYHPDGSYWDYSSASSQDAWIFQIPLPTFFDNTIRLGTMSCDSRIAYHAEQAGLTLVNPCLSVQACHLHLCKIRHYEPIISTAHPLQVIYWSTLNNYQARGEPQGHDFWQHILPTTQNGQAIPFMCAKDKSKYSLDTPFLTVINKLFKPTCFIETGTYLGDTITRALLQFPLVHSIELDHTLARAAMMQFQTHPHVKIHEGDSPVILNQLLPTLQEKKMVIYLDANYNGGLTAKGNVNDPILTELENIKKNGITDALLIIDDARLFYQPLCSVKDSVLDGYPTLPELVNIILAINPAYKFTCIHDVMIAYTDDIATSPVAQACTMSRLFEDKQFEVTDVIMAEKMIGQAIGLEKETLKNLAEQYTEVLGISTGIITALSVMVRTYIIKTKRLSSCIQPI